MHCSPSPFGTNRKAEYERSAEHFDNLCKMQSPYFGLAMLLDSGYGRAELLQILNNLTPQPK